MSTCSSYEGEAGRGCDRSEQPAVGSRPELQASRPGALVEGTMCALVARDGLEEVVGPPGIDRLVRQLRVVALPGEKPIDEAGRDRVRTVGQPTMISRRGCSAAQTTASAATSG
jgi:hypothetical protein